MLYSLLEGSVSLMQAREKDRHVKEAVEQFIEKLKADVEESTRLQRDKDFLLQYVENRIAPLL